MQNDPLRRGRALHEELDVGEIGLHRRRVLEVIGDRRRVVGASGR
jgi:hypothetical protein